MIKERIEELCAKSHCSKIAILCNNKQAKKIQEELGREFFIPSTVGAIFFKQMGGYLDYTQIGNGGGYGGPIAYCEQKGYPYYTFDEFINNGLSVIKKNYNI